MTNSLKELGLGFNILLLGTPFYLLLAYDVFSSIDPTYQKILPIWVSIIISITFMIGFVLAFTTTENKDSILVTERIREGIEALEVKGNT